MKTNELIQLDLRHVWHPCAQMKDYETLKPLAVEKAAGPYIFTKDGNKLIDGISSWWCKSLGHSHPEIKKAVVSQLDNFEHVIMANTCNETLAKLSAELASLCPPLDRVFYVDNGTTGVETAMKMSLQCHAQTGHPEKQYFVSPFNGYHGESILTLAIGDCGLYGNPFKHLFPETFKFGPLEYVSGVTDKNWQNYPEEAWVKIEKQLDTNKEKLAAVVLEPLIQGAGNMKIYSPDLLKRLRGWTMKNNIHLIADEIFTGFGRTGRMLACQYAGISPDMLVLSKGLTAGWGPMAAVLASTETYNVFYDDYLTGKAFLHSNTYAGYAVSAAAALAAINIYRREKIIEQVEIRSSFLRTLMEDVAGETKALANVRSLGFMAAADIINPETGKAFPPACRTGFAFYQNAIKLGALLRPIGDTIYFLPPLNTESDVLEKMASIATDALNETIYKDKK